MRTLSSSRNKARIWLTVRGHTALVLYCRLERILKTNIETCEACSGAVKVIASIEERAEGDPSAGRLRGDSA